MGVYWEGARGASSTSQAFLVMLLGVASSYRRGEARATREAGEMDGRVLALVGRRVRGGKGAIPGLGRSGFGDMSRERERWTGARRRPRR